MCSLSAPQIFNSTSSTVPQRPLETSPSAWTSWSLAAARDAGKEAGILVRDLADVPRHLDLGFTHIAVDSDLSILRKAWQQTLSTIQALA